MRRKFIVVLMCLAMLFSFASCGSTNENTNNANNEAFIVGKTLYECDKFELSCEKISSEGVEFKCKNKTNEEVKMYLTIALDGTVASLWSESNETTIAPNKSQAFYMHGSLEITEHKLMSVNGTAFIDSGNISFDICDFNLGGKENKSELPKGESYYSTEDLIVEYIGANAQGLEFKVVNNRDESITFGADTLTINGESKDYAITVTTVPAHSQDIYNVDILSYNEDYFSNQLTSFEGVLEARIDGKGKVDRFPVSYNKDESTTETTTEKVESTTTEKTTEKTIIRLGYAEAARVFEAEFEKFNSLINNVTDNIDYYNDNDFTELEDIKTYESMWKKMSDEAYGIYTTLTEKTPPEKYEDVWCDFAECMKELSDIFAKGADLNTNHDNEYTGDEIVAVIKEIGDEFVEVSTEAIELTEELKALSNQVAETSNNKTETTKTTQKQTTKAYNTKTCVECGKSASYTYTNPFSYKVEDYCYTHYNEIISMMGEMEEDVGKGSYSKHTCEQCSREGTHTYYSFTGQTEYYCTQHYEELKSMLNSFGLN